MINQKFINTICEYYVESRKLNIDPKGHNIWRGVSHPISSKAEDLFALFIAENLKDDSLEFIVDKTFSFKDNTDKSVSFRPDLAIVRKNKITHIFDLKMDMGYKRRYFETDSFQIEEKKFQLFRSGEEVKVSFTRAKSKRSFLNVSPKIKNQIVVISEKNGGKASNRLDMIEAINRFDWVNMYYLTSGVHPNNYNGEQPVLNNAEFERLFNDINEQLT